MIPLDLFSARAASVVSTNTNEYEFVSPPLITNSATVVGGFLLTAFAARCCVCVAGICRVRVGFDLLHARCLLGFALRFGRRTQRADRARVEHCAPAASENQLRQHHVRGQLLPDQRLWAIEARELAVYQGTPFALGRSARLPDFIAGCASWRHPHRAVARAGRLVQLAPVAVSAGQDHPAGRCHHSVCLRRARVLRRDARRRLP